MPWKAVKCSMKATDRTIRFLMILSFSCFPTLRIKVSRSLSWEPASLRDSSVATGGGGAGATRLSLTIFTARVVITDCGYRWILARNDEWVFYSNYICYCKAGFKGELTRRPHSTEFSQRVIILGFTPSPGTDYGQQSQAVLEHLMCNN